MGYLTPVSEPAAGQEESGSSAPSPPKDPLRRSRTSSAWVAVVGCAILLVLLVVFIAQNTQDVEVSFVTWEGRAPLAVSLLVAALIGILLTVVTGSLRILQLRRRVRRSRG
jgi:uncharacterized integral membrane protein